ncbi:hypothetical protein [Stenotrophomonas lacuserhaii]|uniref:hypothetical protein n=1 Tax=Stenotrophomonas lacuserhaii TaxID=2760084 RepID=UPI0015F9C6B8|nr:hypothetical protein [Stenotrophomonas lacuserhaii]
MSVFSETVAGNPSPLKKLELALQNELVGSKHKKDTDIVEAFPTIEQHLVRKVPVKVALEMFNVAYGHKIHPPRFRKMLEDERKRRAEFGEVVACTACGQQLMAAVTAANEVNEANGQEEEQ